MSTYPWKVHLDRKVCLTGSYSDPTTTWTLPFNDSTINRCVLSDDFGDSAGTILTLTRPNADTATVDGDYSAGCCTLGRLYEMSIELTRPYRRRRDGTADLDAYTNIRKVIAAFRESGPFTIQATQTGFATRTKTFTQDDGEISDEAIETMEDWISGPADLTTVSIISENPKPVIVPTVDIWVDNTERRR